MQPSVIHEIPTFLHVLSDGSVSRFIPPISPLSSSGAVLSKDVVIDSDKPITARIFLPNPSPSSAAVSRRFPVVFYIHGGGFCIGSTSWIGYHSFLASAAEAAGAIFFSVDYRLAPENPLPAAYDDCYQSLKWVASHATDGTEPYLLAADTTRLFLAGDSAGANICHNIALRALDDGGTDPVGIAGVLLLHPFFGSEKRTAREEADTGKELAVSDSLWKLSLPEGENRDYAGCNFEMAEFTAEVWRRFPRTEVHVGEHDFLKERGVLYAEFVGKKGIKVEVVEDLGESHVFFLFSLESSSTRLLLTQISSFINS